ncbi:MAG: hypothetical protein FWC45_02790, partial [Treponema sp.]|nr:hypothetical protein [Treponema sp.]
MKIRLLIIIVYFALLAGCEGGPIQSSYRAVLPELPGRWTEILGEPCWRFEWAGRDGTWQETEIAPGAEAPAL